MVAYLQGWANMEVLKIKRRHNKMRPQNKKKTKPRKTAKAKARPAKLTPLQKLKKENQELLDRCCNLAKANREKAEHICQQREQINNLVAEVSKVSNEAMACDLEKKEIITSNSFTIKEIEKNAISKIRLLKAGLILSLAVNIICIIILLYLINY